MTDVKELFTRTVIKLTQAENYDAIMLNLIELCDAISFQNEPDWDAQYETIRLDDLIIGAYWHFADWHEGQRSLSYQVLSALGNVFISNGIAPERDNAVYQMLGDIASRQSQ